MVQSEIIGIIPAAGVGPRIAHLPCSKEVYPIGYDQCREGRPKAVTNYLLEKMQSAGIKKPYIILREGRWGHSSLIKKLLNLRGNKGGV